VTLTVPLHRATSFDDIAELRDKLSRNQESIAKIIKENELIRDRIVAVENKPVVKGKQT
jgi:hypothetical protein